MKQLFGLVDNGIRQLRFLGVLYESEQCSKDRDKDTTVGICFKMDRNHYNAH